MVLKQHKKILLGSGSPRRQLLLKELGYEFRVLTSNTEEIPHPDLRKGEIAVRLAEEKADALQNVLMPDEILITADTIVCLDKMILGKPADALEAFGMIKMLSGKMHEVYTGICLMDDRKRKSLSVCSEVIFNNLSDEIITAYIEKFKPYDKAGAYGAQECLPDGTDPCSDEEKQFLSRIGKRDLYQRTKSNEIKTAVPLINRIEGSYFNVMGLPIVELVNELDKWN